MECWKCVHKINIPGDCHIGCNKPDVKVTEIRNQWNHRPVNFDPVWIKTCDGYSENQDDKLPDNKDPMIDSMRLLFR